MPAALPESPRPSAAGPGGARSRSPSPRHRTHILRGGGGVQSCSPLARRARVDGAGGGITPFLRTARPPLTSPDPGRHLRGESCRRGPARPGPGGSRCGASRSAARAPPGAAAAAQCAAAPATPAGRGRDGRAGGGPAAGRGDSDKPGCEPQPRPLHRPTPAPATESRGARPDCGTVCRREGYRCSQQRIHACQEEMMLLQVPEGD